jgi:hypothetical protein
MHAFLQLDRPKGGGFVSALWSGLLVASLALASLSRLVVEAEGRRMVVAAEGQ